MKTKDMARNHHINRFELAVRAHGLDTVLDWLSEAIDEARKHNANTELADLMHNYANMLRGMSVAFGITKESILRGAKYVITVNSVEDAPADKASGTT